MILTKSCVRSKDDILFFFRRDSICKLDFVKSSICGFNKDVILVRVG